MSGEVIQLFASEADVDAAWEALRKHNQRLLDDPSLITDRPFMEQQARLEAKFKRLLMAQEAKG